MTTTIADLEAVLPSAARRPTIHLIGEVPMVLPCPVDRLGPIREQKVLRIEARARAGLASRELAILILAAEAGWGITDQDRREAMASTEEAWEDELMAVLFTGAEEAERPAPKRIQLPDAERGLTPARVKRVDKLHRKLQLPTLTKDERQAIWDELHEIERGLNDNEEQEALRAHLIMLETLEKGRGGEIEGDGSMRLTRRDGLESLFSAGGLDKNQHDALCRYRALFETVREGLKSQMGSAAGSGEGEGWQEKRLRARITIQAIETRVQAGSRNGRGLTTLRLVAGEGRTISSISKGGSDRALNSRALVRAADDAADVLGIH
jgi:hypothetical protein